MSDYTQTPNLNLYKPTYNADTEQWGNHLNANADKLDAVISSIPGGSTGGFLPTAGGTMTGQLNFATTGAGGLQRSAQDRAADVANVLDFGAVGNQSTDDTAAIQAALNTGKNVYMPAGTYRLTDMITVGSTAHAQTLFGDGKSSRFYIDGRFSSTATSVIALKGNEESAPTIRDIELFFIQPASFTRGAMQTIANGGNGTTVGIIYPVAIDQASSNRFRLERLRLSGGPWIGIQCTNSGWWIRDIEESCLNIGLNMQATSGGDFCHVSGWHHWNFGITWATTPISDGQAYAIWLNSGAGVNLQELNLFGCKLRVDVGSGEAKCTNVSLDGSCAEIVSGNWVIITNVYASANTVNQAAFTLTGGTVSIVNPYGWPASGQPYISNNGANLQLVGGRPQSITADVPVILNQAGFLTLSGVTIAGSTPYATSYPVAISGGQLVMTGCRMAGSPGAGTTQAVGITTDTADMVVVGNQWNTWSFTPPGQLGCYGPNTGSLAATGTHFPSNVTFDGNINFGSALASSTTDYTHFINLFGANYGINVTSNRVNYNSNGSHVFMNAGSDVASVSAAGLFTAANITTPGTLSVTGTSAFTGGLTAGNVFTSSVWVGGSSGPSVTTGSGVPGGTQPVGSLYLRTGGGVGSTLYVSRGAGSWNAVAGV